MPGPTLNTVRGRKVSVLHRNELPVPAVVHLHGAHAAPEHDGYPTDLVLPVGADDHGHFGNQHGEGADISHGERLYEYDNNERAGTYWYHDHRMDLDRKSTRLNSSHVAIS